MSWKRSDRMLNTIREKWSDILYYLKNEYDIYKIVVCGVKKQLGKFGISPAYSYLCTAKNIRYEY